MTDLCIIHPHALSLHSLASVPVTHSAFTHPLHPSLSITHWRWCSAVLIDKQTETGTEPQPGWPAPLTWVEPGILWNEWKMFALQCVREDKIKYLHYWCYSGRTIIHQHSSAAHMATLERWHCRKNPTPHALTAVTDFERLPDAINAIVV